MGYLLLTTGMRASELLALQFNQVKEHSSNTYIEFKGKRDKWRRIPLSQKSIHLIHRLNELMQIEGVSNPHICFNVKTGETPISYEALRLIAQAASAQLTSENNSPHWFRRSFITKLLANGLPLYEVMNLSGHESINTTNSYLQQIRKIKLVTLPYE